jgi:hypothetical protein
LIKARVWHIDDSGVRLELSATDGGGVEILSGERVKNGGLAAVGQSDNSQSHGYFLMLVNGE